MTELGTEADLTPALEATTMTDATADQAPALNGEGSAAPSEAGSSRGDGRRGPAARVPSKFMADLTKAMQAAAESAREEALARLQTDAKTAVEEIQAKSATDAADLRRQADDDVAGIREWSKAEIARIREETDQKIAARKSQLEYEIEEHGASVERRIERVQGRITAYEEQMARFFEGLLNETDPSRFASLAENLPEPPPLDDHDAPYAPAAPAAAAHLAQVPDEAPSTTETTAQPAEPSFGGSDAAMAAIEQSALAADTHDGHNGSHPSPDGLIGDTQVEVVASANGSSANGEADPRLAALAMSPDFAAAEAEAAVAAGSSDTSDEIPTIGDDALAARLAGLVPPTSDDAAGSSTEPQSTQVVVVGLVSVASIASFKRHLGRLAGVQSVGVSSGPDGEFVFAVHHGADIVLRDAIPALPGFHARVTGGDNSTIQVTAR
ncbi:MAG TPA: hypothetical protein VGC90_03890, partial [Candidatus Limnocylindrales bacterium]